LRQPIGHDLILIVKHIYLRKGILGILDNLNKVERIPHQSVIQRHYNSQRHYDCLFI